MREVSVEHRSVKMNQVQRRKRDANYFLREKETGCHISIGRELIPSNSQWVRNSLGNHPKSMTEDASCEPPRVDSSKV